MVNKMMQTTSSTLLKYGLRTAVVLMILYLVVGEISRIHSNYQSQREKQDKTTKQMYKVFENHLDIVRKIDNRLKQSSGLAVHKGVENNFKRPEMVLQKNDSFNYKAEVQKLNKERVAADDPRLVELIRKYYILPQSSLPYNLTEPTRIDASTGQAAYVDSKFNYREGGFFVECGGLDGELSSNTLLFERFRKWNGILIEADPLNFVKLVAKHRKAYAINACLNIEPHPATVTFRQAAHVGRIVYGPTKVKTTTVQCFPLYSILLAINQLHVDFFSLDIEGDELKVLQTIPFDKVNISMMAVEYGHQSTGIMALRKFVESKGFETLLQMSSHTWALNDVLFMKKGMKNY